MDDRILITAGTHSCYTKGHRIVSFGHVHAECQPTRRWALPYVAIAVGAAQVSTVARGNGTFPRISGKVFCSSWKIARKGFQMPMHRTMSEAILWASAHRLEQS